VAVNTASGTFEAGQPQALFEAALRTPALWQPSPDGTRFLLNRPVHDEEPVAVTVLVNWAEGL
jgi:hypothetical protein